MKIIGLNSSFSYVGTYENFIELAWNRKYYTSGDFILYMRSEDYNSNIAYLQVEDFRGKRPEIAIIQKIEYEEKISGEFITLSGFFLEDWLNLYTTSKDTYIGYSASNASNTQYMAMLSRFGVPVTQDLSSATMTTSEVSIEGFCPVGESLAAELQDIESSYRIMYNNGYKIKFSKGEDVSNTVVFARHLGNISELKYTYDESKYRTLCRGYANGAPAEDGVAAVGTKCSDGQYYVINSAGSGARIISANVSVDDIEVNPANATKISNAIPKLCKLELLNYYFEHNVDITVLQQGVFYIKDYDLGNVVKILIPSIGIQYSARIIEVAEIWKENSMTVTLTIGNQVRRKV
jgi:CxxC motif-containing protein